MLTIKLHMKAVEESKNNVSRINEELKKLNEELQAKKT